MKMFARLVTMVVAVLLVPAADAAAAASESTCSTGDAAAAAVELYGQGTQVVETGDVAGLQTALALEPRIAPGTRRRMIAAGDAWCDAAAGFNQAWKAAGERVGDGRAIAEAYARVAAAPYFDGVSVKRVAGGAGAWTVETHARTNGVEATWEIVTDGEGIRTATWTATAFARAPFEASWEGLTALPGASERYTRVASGRLDAARGLPAPATAATRSDEDGPGLLQHTFEDGYTIVTSVGDAQAGVNLGVDTGVQQIDVLRATMRAARENYEEFRRWGFSKGWTALPGFSDDVGYVYVNDALSLYCLACVFVSDHFQIHLLSEVQTALDLLGYDGYKDRERAYSLIIGHEMFHNFQNRYNKPGHFNSAGRDTPTSYSEGTARFQETLHTYATTTFAPRTLVTANDSNGCNGFDTGGSMDAGMAAGPFGKTYNTCFFWGPWYVANGKQAFLNLIREAMPAHSPETDEHLEISRAVEQAAGKPIGDQLAAFAGSAITGRGRAWTTWFGTEPVDWGSLLERWTPAVLASGEETTRVLGAGGMMAHEITEDARVSLNTPTDARLYILHDDGTRLKIRTASGTSTVVGAPPAGERIYALAVQPEAGGSVVTLGAQRPGKPPAPAETGTAQEPIETSVVTLAPGAGERLPGITSQYIEFEVPEGVDNASAKILATPTLPADLDLYLQHRGSDGTWSADLAAGISGELTQEEMMTGRLPAGSYRIEVHNWAGPAGNPVPVKATFYNSEGEPGT